MAPGSPEHPDEEDYPAGFGPSGLPAEDDPELEAWAATPRRRSGTARLVGLVAVVALVVATVGTTVGVLVAGSPTTALSARVTGVAPLGPDGTPLGAGPPPGTTVRQVRVTFTVANPSGAPVTPVCVVEVRDQGRTVASDPVHAQQPLAARASATAQVDVALTRAVSPDALDASVTCSS